MERAIHIECFRQEVTSSSIFTESAVDHSFVIKKHRVLRPQPARLQHCSASLPVAMLLVQRPCEQVVTVHVFSSHDFLLHVRENFRNATIVIEKKETPCAMISTGLTGDRDFHRLVVVFSLRTVA